MGHGMLTLDTMVSGRKRPVWHQDLTGEKTRIVDGLMTPPAAAENGWRRQDGEPGHWDPMLVRCLADAGDGRTIVIPGSFHVARNDMPIDNPARFISAGRGVGAGYTLIDNSTIVQYMEALTLGGAHIDTCGSLFNGARVYMTAYMPSVADVEDEALASFIILTTAHDGTAALEALLSPVRVVCWNTLSFARRNAQTRVKVHHTLKATERLAEAHQIIDAAAKSFGNAADIFRRFASIRVSQQQARDFIEKIIGDTKRAEKTRDRVAELFNGAQIGADSKAVKGTLYGLVSAFTEYIETGMTLRQHEDALGNTKTDAEARAASVLFGAGAKKRDEVFSAALAFADSN